MPLNSINCANKQQKTDSLDKANQPSKEVEERVIL